jgi:glycosyltransferase involved in cell wall biosynthesis
LINLNAVKSTLRILYAESSLNFGGQELRVVEEMEWFRNHGHKVWLAAAEESRIWKLALDRGLPVIPIRFRGSINPVAMAQVFAACRRLHVNLLVTRNSRETSCSWPISTVLGLPLVRYQHICKNLKTGLFQKVLWRYAPDRIVAVSESIKQRLVKQNLASERAISVIGEYVDRAVFHPAVSAGDVRARYGIPNDAFIITNIGMFRPGKGQILLVEAAGDILRKHPNCWFMLIGAPASDAPSDELPEAIRRSPHASRFVLPGFQSETAPYIAASDLICLTSKNEAQSKVIPQAFAMGKLVVAPNVGGIGELLHDQQNGILYAREKPGALAAAIDAAFNCNREKLTANARIGAEQLDVDQVMKRTEQLYQALAR